MQNLAETKTENQHRQEGFQLFSEEDTRLFRTLLPSEFFIAWRGVSTANGIPKETNRNTILSWQLVFSQTNPRKVTNVILRVITISLDFIPNWYDDINRLKAIQSIAHRAGVGYSGPALHPIAYGDNVVIRISGVNVGIAVARLGQAGCEGRYAILPSPGKPAKIAWLRAVENILNHVADFHAVK